ncbi:MAG: hypothetical protein WC141_06780 [Arcobacteraceae bacterium]|jgi:hypothetical protein
MKNALIILGMHRSGTSALMGALKLSGVDLGKDLMGETADNAKGYFENKKIVDFNEDLLDLLQHRWNDVFLIDTNKLKELSENESLEQKAISIIKHEFETSSLIGIKDPRMCILFPFWSDILQTMGYTVNVILPHRDPVEIAKSLEKRNDFTIEFSLLLWAKHALYAEKYSRNFQRIFISYHDLLESPEKQIKNIYSAFLLPLSENGLVALNSFIDKNLNRSSQKKSESCDMPSFIQDLISAYVACTKQDTTCEVDIFDKLYNDYIFYTSFFLNRTTETLMHEKVQRFQKQKTVSKKIENFFKQFRK